VFVQAERIADFQTTKGLLGQNEKECFQLVVRRVVVALSFGMVGER
jgi:hypothetical protein